MKKTISIPLTSIYWTLGISGAVLAFFTLFSTINHLYWDWPVKVISASIQEMPDEDDRFVMICRTEPGPLQSLFGPAEPREKLWYTPTGEEENWRDAEGNKASVFITLNDKLDSLRKYWSKKVQKEMARMTKEGKLDRGLLGIANELEAHLTATGLSSARVYGHSDGSLMVTYTHARTLQAGDVGYLEKFKSVPVKYQQLGE